MNIFNIISSTPVNPLAIVGNGNFQPTSYLQMPYPSLTNSYPTLINMNPNMNPSAIVPLTINNMGELNKTKPVILVDTSYWLYYRFFALRNWYKKVYPTVVAGNPNFDTEHDWLKDQIFMDKYRKLFIENIKVLSKKYKTIMQNVVFCLDCSYKDIWRNSHTTEYKANRPESLKKKQFNSFNVFSYIKKDYLPILQVKYGIKILYNSRCEADDVIGQFAPFLIANGVPAVYIIANDNDYMQICNDKIIMIKGGLSNSPTSNSSSTISNTLEGDGKLYLLRKILIGDVSDNIRPCIVNKILLEKTPTFVNNGSICVSSNDNKGMKVVTKNTVEILLADEERCNFFLQLLEYIRCNDIKDSSDPRLLLVSGFYDNVLLMDFKMIPQDLQRELDNKFKNLLGL
jgi:5'-3' exonuclease